MSDGPLTVVEGVVLGLVQGLTEFLPISSTAHLRVVPALLGWQDPGAAASAVLQLGTTAALLLYFWKDLVLMTRSGVAALVRRDFSDQNGRLALGICVGTIPIVVAGLLLKHHVEATFRDLRVIAGALVFFGVLLVWSDRTRAGARRDGGTIGFADAVLVGIAQTFALIPGASRSGVTMTGAFFLGIERTAAARFSFLLSIPAVGGAGLYELWSERADLLAPGSVAGLVAGTIVSGVVGYASIAGLLRFLRSRGMGVFVVYRVLLAALLVALVRAHVVESGA
jgi:undecaprenyl-diphosphatase